jgi:hypothetical protein
VWRSDDGTSWNRVASGGFNFPDNWEVSSLIVFEDQIFAGTLNRNVGCQVWKSASGETWSRANFAGFGDDANELIPAMAVHDDQLYLSTNNETTGVEIWRSPNGVLWEQVNEDGFGKPGSGSADAMMSFDGHLYVGVVNSDVGAEVWRTADGSEWQLVASGGLGLSENEGVGAFLISDGWLYAGTANSTSGCELWRSASGLEWEAVAVGGFGTNGNRAATELLEFDRKLYVGTLNFASGCEVWRTPLCAARRSLPSCYVPERATHVVIETTIPDTAASHTVEDVPPSGWTVSDISHGGSFSGGAVTWGPFDDTQARTLTYAVTPPADAFSPEEFSGTITIGGEVQDICGDAVIDLDCDQADFHPADLDDNWRDEIDEITAYGAAWLNSTPWVRPPNPIPIEYVTNAGLIWIEGEIYHYASTQYPPWLPGYGKALTGGGTAMSTLLPSTYIAGEPVEVSISVTPDAGTANYAIQDGPPLGWPVTGISNDGHFDEINGLVKWGPFYDDDIRALSYTVTPPAGESGSKTFLGVASFDGSSEAIGGDRVLDGGGAPPCSPSDTVMCLGGDRFQLEIQWRDFAGGSGPGHVVPITAADSGLFWFFDETNWEMLVKVLDGCGVNGHYWVFAAATTNIEYTLTVTDTDSGEEVVYTNPLGVSSPAVTDAEAFPTCP